MNFKKRPYKKPQLIMSIKRNYSPPKFMGRSVRNVISPNLKSFGLFAAFRWYINLVGLSSQTKEKSSRNSGITKWFRIIRNNWLNRRIKMGGLYMEEVKSGLEWATWCARGVISVVATPIFPKSRSFILF